MCFNPSVNISLSSIYQICIWNTVVKNVRFTSFLNETPVTVTNNNNNWYLCVHHPQIEFESENVSKLLYFFIIISYFLSYFFIYPAK